MLFASTLACWYGKVPARGISLHIAFRMNLSLARVLSSRFLYEFWSPQLIFSTVELGGADLSTVALPQLAHLQAFSGLAQNSAVHQRPFLAWRRSVGHNSQRTAICGDIQ